MPLPLVPLQTGNIAYDLDALYEYLYYLQDQFVNAVGEGIDPTSGYGGDSSLTIVDVPGSIVYSPGVTLSVDGVLIGHIDVTFTKPERTVDIIVFYREQGTANFKQSYASESPFRLISLRADTIYEVQLAGQAANGSLGPVSPLTAVNVSTMTDLLSPLNLVAGGRYQSVLLQWQAPVSASLIKFEVQSADDSAFTVGVLTWDVFATRFVDDLGSIGVTKWYRVRSVDSIGNRSLYTAAVSATTLNVPDESIDTAKIANDAVTYAKIQNVSAASRVLLRGSASGAGDVQEGTVGSGLTINGTEIQLTSSTSDGTYTPTLTNVANLDGSTAYELQYIRVGNTVVVSGRVDVDPTLTATLTTLRISLPVVSNLTAAHHLAGAAFTNSVAGQGAALYVDVTNDEAIMEFVSADTSNRGMFFTFMYRVL